MSLAGVQTKLAVAGEKTGDVCIADERLSFHAILKQERHALGAFRRAFCLTWLDAAKITTPKRHHWQGRKRTSLLVSASTERGSAAPLGAFDQDGLLEGAREAPSAQYELTAPGFVAQQWRTV